MDVQTMDEKGVSIAPRGQYVLNRGWPEIQLQHAGELQEALAAAAEAGVARISFELLFSDWWDGWSQMQYQRSPGRGLADRRATKAACERVGHALQDAVRDAMQDELRPERELHVGVRLDFDRQQRSWRARGRGKVVEIIDELDGISIALN